MEGRRICRRLFGAQRDIPLFYGSAVKHSIYTAIGEREKGGIMLRIAIIEQNQPLQELLRRYIEKYAEEYGEPCFPV